MPLDTLKISESLKDSFTEEQAKALARVLGDAADDQFLTKSDLTKIEIKLAEVRADLTEVRRDLRSDIEDIRLEIGTSKNDVTAQISLLRTDTLKWIVSAIFANAGIVGLIIGLTKFFGK